MNWFRKLFGLGKKNKTHSNQKKSNFHNSSNSNSITDPMNPLYMSSGFMHSSQDLDHSGIADTQENSIASDFGSSASDFGSNDSSFDSGSFDSGSSDSGSSFGD